MNLPGIPDYSYFIGQFIATVQGMGLQGWFTGAAGAAIVFAFVWALALFAWGNRMAAQAVFVRAMVALLLFNLATRPEGAAFKSSLYDAWRNGHRVAAQRALGPVADSVGQALLDIRDTVRNALVAIGSFAVGGFALNVFRGGLAGARAAVRASTVAKGELGGTTRGIGGAGAYQAVKTSVSKMGQGALLLTAPYVGAMMLSGVMVYLAIVLLPLAATAMALGVPAVFRAVLSLYLSGLLLGIVAPVVLGASLRLLQHTSVAQMQQQLQQIMAEAESVRQQQRQAIAQLRSEVENYGNQVENQVAQNTLQKKWDDIREWFAGAVSGAAQAVGNAMNTVLAPLNNMLTSLASWIVTGVVGIFMYLLTILGILIGVSITLNRVASAVRI
ncbi:hypothetical protein [Thermus caldilimi]|uniref:hypothetical protein n=1 Tax=Thermus caldilimi TaxID=2483360 RepID=UPI00107684FD|nr:hypothetical protein [Thermus caldilimi]